MGSIVESLPANLSLVQRAQALRRGLRKLDAVPDMGIEMRNGWPVRRTAQKPLPKVFLAMVEPLPPPKPEPIPAPPPQLVTFVGSYSEFVQTPRPPDKRITIKSVIFAVSKEYRIVVADLIGSSRTANIVRPRQIVYWLARTMTGRSLPYIGRMVGHRDHTTILSGFKKIERLMAEDAEFAAQVLTLRDKIAGQVPA